MRTAEPKNSGFTLIEVIVAIMVSAILAALLMQMMSGHVTRSLWPLENINQGLELREVMETISADYRRRLTDEPEPLMALQAAIDGGGNPGGYWDGQPYAAQIQVNRYCLDLDRNGESPARPCSSTDTLMKVTITYGNHSLTTLFSR